MTVPAPHTSVLTDYHTWLIKRRFVQMSTFERYVERLCRFITLEIEAGRMFWSYELPGDETLEFWYRKYLREFKARQATSKKFEESSL